MLYWIGSNNTLAENYASQIYHDDILHLKPLMLPEKYKFKILVNLIKTTKIEHHKLKFKFKS